MKKYQKSKKQRKINMAWQLPTYTDSAGQTYTNTYWKIVPISVDTLGQTFNLQVLGFVNKTCRENLMPSIGGAVYAASGDSTAYDAYFSPAAQTAAGKDLVAQAYAYILTTPEGQAFFTGATEV